MNVSAIFLRAVAKCRFRLLGFATIKDVPTERFHRLTSDLIAAGWRKTYEYTGIDAWIDYGCVKLKKDGVRLKLEWDNWTEGSVEGPRDTLKVLADNQGLAVSGEWRWAEQDKLA
jgi:hypothetical protein